GTRTYLCRAQHGGWIAALAPQSVGRLVKRRMIWIVLINRPPAHLQSAVVYIPQNAMTVYPSG
ncbi:MAG: hypothetical protein V7764_11990, partial [Pseudomonas marincola]|uniref:hypothetical protein n=1 Tax=Pseudomonas marincola TaxID=437900 RepID=UPI003001900F